ncbi:MAG: response regulator transcription factor [Dehalococcoidia bacterium]|nr:response regulator transcription factor [Dehalococcoidia bacterium]MDZ4245862.1 response regulator transcription factor [Dehalococcoidia bacterium]
MSNGKILIVDDEPRIVELVKLYLEKDGYQTVSAGGGKQALELFRKENPDLIVLDLMLPEMDGLEVCRQVRRISDVPIIMLTARAEDTDKLIGLELGADDYVTKPFSPREVAARVKTVLRRAREPREQKEIRIGPLFIDLLRHEVSCGQTRINLTNTEFKLLSTLAENPGRVFTRAQLLDTVLGMEYEGYDRTIDTHIKNLRQKMGAAADSGACRIVTVHGVGYKLGNTRND